MKKLLIMAFGMGVLLLASGCASTHSRGGDALNTAYLDNPLNITDRSLQKVLNVDYIGDVLDDRPVVQYNVYNTSDRVVSFSYVIQWFEPRGFLAEQAQPVRVRIDPRDYYFIKATAPEHDAIHYRLSIRR